ncbi:hypothetical protein WJX82_001524 [Trebouxia sp. C0006]
MKWQIPAGLSCLLPVVLAILVACLIPRHINKALRGGIADEIVWSENSSADTYARYARDDHDSDPVIHSDFYVLNITNLASVKAGGRPELQQLGPYTYRKHTVKHNIWFDKKGRVAFTRDEFYTALSDNATHLSLDDVITTVNIPLLGALAKAHSFFGRVVALQLLLEVLAAFHDPNVDGLFMTRTVRELLWGYEDPLLQKLKFIAPGLDTRFQLGSDGVQFRPSLKSGDKVEVWAPEVYKSATLLANTTVDLDGVNLLRFRPDPAQGLPNPTYFQNYQGLMNITSPTAAGPEGRAGAPGPPIFLSNAHFCDVDPAVADTVVGLNCSQAEHVTFLDVEPMTGITMRAAKRLMMSTQYGPEWRAVEPHVKKTFLPIFWVEEWSQATSDQLTSFKSQVYGTQRASKIVLWVSIGVACFFGLLALILLTAPWWDKRHSGNDPEAGGGDSGQQEPLLGPGTPNNATGAD